MINEVIQNEEGKGEVGTDVKDELSISTENCNGTIDDRISENETGGDIKGKTPVTEEDNAGSSEEMINLPDTFFDDLMDVEFLGSFDVVDSWKQDEDNGDGKSEEEICAQRSEGNEEVKTSKLDAKDRRVNTSDRSRSDRSTRIEERRARNYFPYRDNRDRSRPQYRRAEYSSARSKNDRSRSRSKKESTSTSRPRRDRSTSRSKHGKRSTSRTRKERSTSRTRKERSTSRTRKERSTSRTRKERSTSRTRKERSTSRTKRGRSTSRSRKERSTSQSRRSSASRYRKDKRSSSRSRQEVSASRSRKELSSPTSRKENISYPKGNAAEIEESNELQNVHANKNEQDENVVKDLNENNTHAINKLSMKDKQDGISQEISTEPAPPGLEEDIVPPGEEPLLIKPNLVVSEKDISTNQQKRAENANYKEKSSSDNKLPVEKLRLRPEGKNESGSLVRRGSDMEVKQKMTGSFHEEVFRNRESAQERSRELYAASRREFSFSDRSSSRKRSTADIGPSHSRSRYPRSISVEKEQRDKYRTRDSPIDNASIERDIRHFKWLRMLEKQDNAYKHMDLDQGISRTREHKDMYYYSSRERQRSPSIGLSLSSISLSSVQSRYSRSPLHLSSHSRHRSRNYRRRSYSPRSNDSLRSLSLLSLSSAGSMHMRKDPKYPHRRSRRRQPFYEEITQKLGIRSNPPEHLYPQQHEMTSGPQSGVIPYEDPPPQLGLMPPAGYPVPPGPVADVPPNIHVPPPNFSLPPPNIQVPQAGPPIMLDIPTPITSYPPPQYMGMPAPLPTAHQPMNTAPAGPVFSVQSNTKDSSSLSSYLEATMKGETSEVSQQQPPDVFVRKAGEDTKLLSSVVPEVVARCEEAVAAVRAENALSMVPLGRVIVQPKAPGSSRTYSIDGVSCLRSPLFDLSNPSFSFTTPPLHDFVSSNLKTAARKLRRSEQFKHLRNARLGESSRRSTQQVQLTSVGINTDISCSNNEWCCKCQAYNVSSSTSRAPSKLGPVTVGKRNDPEHHWRSRGRRNSKSENSDDSDVQIIGEGAAASNMPGRPFQDTLKNSNKPPENQNFTPVVQTGVQSSRNLMYNLAPNVPTSGLSSLPQLGLPFAQLPTGMSLQQFEKFSAGFSESQRRYQESLQNCKR